MIDLEKEHEAFNAEFKNIGREYSTNLNSVGFSGTLSANELGWLACAESKQAEIDSLKAQQKLNKPARIGGTVFRKGVAWETVIECAQRHYDYGQRDTQPTPLISPSDAIKLASGELVLVPKDPTFQMKQAAYKQYDTGLISITEIYQAMIEAAQEDRHDNSN